MKLTAVCLSLPRCRERRERFADAAGRAGLVFEFSDGPDARLLPADQLLTLADQDHASDRFGRRLALSEIACAEGHRQIYRNLLRSGDDAVLIFEDDVALDLHVVDVVEKLKSLDSELARRSDIYFLGGREEFEQSPLWVSRRRPLRLSATHRLLKVIKSEGALLRTCSYLITRAAAAAILQRERAISTTADSWETRVAEGLVTSAWILEPPVAFHEQAPGDSLIDEDRAPLEAEAATAKRPSRGVMQLAADPRRLWWSLLYRLGWRRLKAAAYALLSRVT